MPFGWEACRMNGVYTSRFRVLLLECVLFNDCSFGLIAAVVEAFTFFFVGGIGTSCQ